MVLATALGQAEPARVTTVAGGGKGDDAPATSAAIAPTAVALDPLGRLLIVDELDLSPAPGPPGDRWQKAIRRVEHDGRLSLVGRIDTDLRHFYRNTRIFGPAAQPPLVQGLAVGPDGTVYATELSTDRVIAIHPDGRRAVIAGPRDGLRSPSGLAATSDGAVVVADSGNHRVVRIDAHGTITTIAGTGTAGFSGDGGSAARARLRFPRGVAVSPGGDVLIADTRNHRLRRVDAATGTITTIAGTGQPGTRGDGGPATRARLSYPVSVATGLGGDVFIADREHHAVRRIDPTGTITTRRPGLHHPEGLTVDPLGRPVVAEYFRVQRLEPNGPLTPLAGTGRVLFSGDGGPAAGAGLCGPAAAAVAPDGAIVFSDAGNRRVRRVATDGTITTLYGPSNGAPSGVAIARTGDVYISEPDGHRVIAVTAVGGVRPVAGTGEAGTSGDGGPATSARLRTPVGLTIDTDGNLYIADAGAHRVRRLDAATGTITTVAGTGIRGEGRDGRQATKTQLDRPTAVAVDQAGALYVTDMGSSRIRRVALSGTTRTVARLRSFGVAVAEDGTVYASSVYGTVERIGRSSRTEPVAGTDWRWDPGSDGRPPLWEPRGIAITPRGDLLVADTGYNLLHRVALGRSPGEPTEESGFSARPLLITSPVRPPPELVPRSCDAWERTFFR